MENNYYSQERILKLENQYGIATSDLEEVLGAERNSYEDAQGPITKRAGGIDAYLDERLKGNGHRYAATKIHKFLKDSTPSDKEKYSAAEYGNALREATADIAYYAKKFRDGNGLDFTPEPDNSAELQALTA